ncbi:MAG: T9SS type A sorting domain-containing protein [Psychroflexus sp.]
MKLKLLFICYLLFSVTANCQLLQKNIEFAQGHLIDANLAQINDGSNDVIIASNVQSTASPVPVLKRLEDDGTIVWSKTYDDPTLANARIFDITNYFDLIFMTGSIDVGGVKKVFIAKIEAATGNLLDDRYYDIVNSNFNSTGFKVIISETDANGDNILDEGLLVTGFFGSCPNADPGCNLNIGFALRTDLNLNNIWVAEVDSFVSGANIDYDFVNGVIETSDGFVLTGSATGQGNTSTQAGVLAHKIDFEGQFIWDSSYIFGNSRDVSVDAYYDTTTDEVFILNNYSSIHHFGVTVLDNANGAINNTKSWYANESNNSLDFYGFSLVESLSSPDNLIIYGYRRGYFNGTNTDQTNIFVHEFDKATGNQVGTSYQYTLPYQEPMGGVYGFWSSQLPLIYYPDMALYDTSATTPTHYAVGYRNGDPANGSFSNIEFMNVDAQKMNACDNLILNFNTNTLGTINSIANVTSALASANETVMALDGTSVTLNEDSCSTQLSVRDQNRFNLKIYPNPASDYVYLNQNTDVNKILIRDITGKTVFETNVYNKNEGIFVGNLSKGVYFIRIGTSDNATGNLKLIKN